MFGNLVNNRQLKNLIDAKIIEINPFNTKNLSTAHYTLHVGKVLKKNDDGSFSTTHDFSENPNPFRLEKNGYIIIEIFETIKLNDENIVGHFIPVSTLIKDGLSITAGKIDKKYGNLGPSKGLKSEMIQFGLKNNLNEDKLISADFRIAHLVLYDLRGVASEKAELSATEKKEIAKRLLIAMDSGVNYEDE